MELRKASYKDTPLLTEEELMGKLLCTDNGAVWIELGCGEAKPAQILAKDLPRVRIHAYEVDEKQHDKNLALQSSCPDNLTFGKAGMQDFPAENGSVDAIVMLKSLHHVPKEYMADGFARIKNALKPGGKLFISEPVFDGDFNEILRIFHDEQEVRSHAFDMVKAQVDSGNFDLQEEIHFQKQVIFRRGFQDFEEKILNSTFNNFSLTDNVIQAVGEKFQKHEKADGSAEFLAPLRVDVLVKRTLA